ncbi:MAG: hypothetical protein WC217_01985 [Candidatus Paceibacterota bacterium]|jgi:hypothetical protein
MDTSQRGFIVPLLLIFVAILLVGGGAYVYLQQKQDASPSISESPVAQASSTAQTSDSQTVGWKTYSDTYIGYRIKYPTENTRLDKSTDDPCTVISYKEGFVAIDCDSSLHTFSPDNYHAVPTETVTFNQQQSQAQGYAKNDGTGKFIFFEVNNPNPVYHISDSILEIQYGFGWKSNAIQLSEQESLEIQSTLLAIMKTFQFDPTLRGAGSLIPKSGG